MSRTYKDSRRKYHFKDYWIQDHIQLEGYGYRLTKTTKPKKRKIRPQRRAGRLWEAEFINSDIDMWALEDADTPGISHKPHIYFW